VTTTTPATCNLLSLSPSPAVTAFSTVKQSTFGCFHPEAAGVLPQDVHVIDLKTSELPQDVHVIDLKTSELSHSRRRRRETSAPRVEVDLVPSSGENHVFRRIRTSDFWIWIRILEVQKHADPDAQHCL
jgi:hypothetical protein